MSVVVLCGWLIQVYGAAAPPSPSNVKGELQMLVQRLGFPLPTYTLLPPKGPSHDRTFTVKLQVWVMPQRELWTGMASGKTKKEAEVEVARQGLQYMQDPGSMDRLVCIMSMCSCVLRGGQISGP